MNNNKKEKIHTIFLEIAESISKMSNCVSLNVGCVITKNNRIVSTGYNGTPPGFINCCDKFPEYNKQKDRAEHSVWSSNFEIHAEMNAIIAAAKAGIALEDCIMYCTYSPCHNCLKHIIATGIKEIYYSNLYDKANWDEETDKLINESNILMCHHV
jgi:dCMP deaminase